MTEQKSRVEIVNSVHELTTQIKKVARDGGLLCLGKDESTLLLEVMGNLSKQYIEMRGQNAKMKIEQSVMETMINNLFLLVEDDPRLKKLAANELARSRNELIEKKKELKK